MSQIVRDLLEEYRNDPDAYKDLPDMEGPPVDTLTVYVPAEPWLETRDVAYSAGRTPVALVIRKGLRARLDAKRTRKKA